MDTYLRELRNLIGTRPYLMAGAAVALLDSDNRLLLHHRTENDCWGLPGGATDLGESVEDTALAGDLRGSGPYL